MQIRKKRSNRHGGGVAFYCKDALSYDIRQDVPVSNLEMLSVEIAPPNAKPHIILLSYRPPSDNTETFEKLENMLCSLWLRAVDQRAHKGDRSVIYVD